MKTFRPKEKDVERQWYEVDAEEEVLGRLASRVARLLRGKHKPIFHPAVDTGDFVIVKNAKKVKLTGKKKDNKYFNKHTGYPGNLKSYTYGEMIEKHPITVIRKAVKGMLPDNKLRRKMMKRLKVYEGNEHPHEAQKPEKYEL